MAANHPPETNFGTVTSWIPLTTAWPLTTACFSSFDCFGDFATGAPIFIFDPLYGISVDTAFRCLPPAVTTWWDQQNNGDTGTIVSLGPVMCPVAYTTAYTSLVNGQSTLVGCCPTGYDFIGINPQGDADECTSVIHAGQRINYVYLTGNPASWISTSATLSTATVAYAVQINGYNFASTPSATSTSTPTSMSTSASTLSPGGTSSTSPATASNSGLGTDETVVIAFGVSLSVLGICLLLVAIFLIRRQRAKNETAFQLTQLQGAQNDTDHRSQHSVPIQEVDGATRPHELETGDNAIQLSSGPDQGLANL
jgi:hypothetical protein